MAIYDISRAHFYAVSLRKVYCNLPAGEEQEGKCARLEKPMYGTLDAASMWQETYSRVLSDSGIEQSVAWPTLFVHRGRDLKLFLVHGDDLVALGSDELKFLEGTEWMARSDPMLQMESQ